MTAQTKSKAHRINLMESIALISRLDIPQKELLIKQLEILTLVEVIIKLIYLK